MPLPERVALPRTAAVPGLAAVFEAGGAGFSTTGISWLAGNFRRIAHQVPSPNTIAATTATRMKVDLLTANCASLNGRDETVSAPGMPGQVTANSLCATGAL